MAHSGFAVIDFETTGLAPEYGHRVIELAVVHVAPDGTIEDRHETVVNPLRDLGPTRIHGLRGAQVKDAPLFADIAPEFIDLLRGRVLVAHNASFEARFLRAELARLGVSSPVENGDPLCTMRLARQFLPGGGRSLADCCAAYDIPLDNAHRAMADTVATAQLLAAYVQENALAQVWDTHREIAQAQTWPQLPRRGTRWVSRTGESPERSFLDRAVAALPQQGLTEGLWWAEDSEGADTPDYEYLGLLDEALSDGFISLDEADELSALAEGLNLNRAERVRIHHEYFNSVVAAAHSDGVLEEAEKQQIRAVATLLSIEAPLVARALRAPAEAAAMSASAGITPVMGAPAMSASTGIAEPASPGDQDLALPAGSLVVFTGDMPEPRSYYEALAASLGWVAKAAVSKRVSLVIAEDIDSLSGKARKARDYGIPIIDHRSFISAVGGA